MIGRKEALSALTLVALLLVLTPSTAYAYVGPGGILTAIGAMLALFAAIVAAFAGFLWYPLKRLLAWTHTIRGRPEPGGPAPEPQSESMSS